MGAFTAIYLKPVVSTESDFRLTFRIGLLQDVA
jgi:hypothetical protein